MPGATVDQVDPKPFRFNEEQYYRMSELGWFEGQKVELLQGEVWTQYGKGDHLEPALRHFSREEYYQIVDLGWFEGHRVALIGGEILEMPAQYDIHLASVTLTQDAIRLAFGPGFWVRVQGSLDLSPHGIPDPDLAVVAGTPRGVARTIATSALFVVEVSDSSLAYDRGAKASLYAAGGIADYWIVNLAARQLEVHRGPVADATQAFGFGYSSHTVLDLGDTSAPLATPNALVTVADLLP